MDPLSAFGLVSSIITFIDFGYKVISTAREVNASATGTTAANDHVEFLNKRMEAVATDLETASLSPEGMSSDKRRLAELANKCLGLSNDLQKLLNKLRARDPKSKRQLLRSIIQNVRRKDEKGQLESRLDQCRQQLHLQLTHTTRLESLSRLDEIAQTGKCQARELATLKQQLAILKDVLAGMNEHSKLQDEARSVLDLSDLAVSKVLQNNILEALRFEKMESRFDNIEESHAETFKWLLEEASPNPVTLPTTEKGDPWSINMLPHMRAEEPQRRDIQKSFTNWLSNGTGIFHISGKPGAGKSTLMKYLADSDEVRKFLNTWAGEKKLVLASFFFWRHGTDFQKSLQGLLRSLLYSVLDKHPELARIIFPDQWDAASSSPGKTIHFRQSDIQKAFVGLTKTPEVHLRHSFAFFIDGLDEFQGHDDKLIKTLFEWAQSGPESIKICVASRELPIYQQRFAKCPKFRLHEVTFRDIFLFVYDSLRNNEDAKLISKPRDVADLGQMLVQRAEGVFLWATLALRLVERGLLLEESLQDLRGSIDVLPSEIEQLFRVIFDSIRTEPDLARRRKAMRLLSLAVDELEITPCNDNLFLTHLSFMDDFDRDPNFVDHMPGHYDETDRSKRLSRCQKQVLGDCRGFLSIRSTGESRSLNTKRSLGVMSTNDGLARKEAVKLTHRSLVEFFQLPDVRVCIEEHSHGFDRLRFYCQSLLAELKVWSISQVQVEYIFEDDGSKASSVPARGRMFDEFPRRTRSEFLYGRLWLVRDLKRLISLYYHTQDPDTSTLFSTLNHLRQIASAEADSTWALSTEYTCRWAKGGACAWRHYSRPDPVRCHPEVCVILVAMEYGLYEFWPADYLDDTLRKSILQLIEESLANNWLDKKANLPDMGPEPPAFDRLLRSLAICLAGGTSANSPILVEELDDPVSIWQNLVWHSIVTSIPGASPAPVWLLFLLYGANQDFAISFEQTRNSSDIDNCSKLVSVTGQWGSDKQQVHSPIHIHEDCGGILDIAKCQDWTVSLKDITDFWFPAHSEKFRRIYESQQNSAHLQMETLRDLRRELGLDPDFWETQVWDVPPPLFESWTGTSEILPS